MSSFSVEKAIWNLNCEKHVFWLDYVDLHTGMDLMSQKV